MRGLQAQFAGVLHRRSNYQGQERQESPGRFRTSSDRQASPRGNSARSSKESLSQWAVDRTRCRVPPQALRAWTQRRRCHTSNSRYGWKDQARTKRLGSSGAHNQGGREQSPQAPHHGRRIVGSRTLARGASAIILAPRPRRSAATGRRRTITGRYPVEFCAVRNRFCLDATQSPHSRRSPPGGKNRYGPRERI